MIADPAFRLCASMGGAVFIRASKYGNAADVGAKPGPKAGHTEIDFMADRSHKGAVRDVPSAILHICRNVLCVPL